jgi:D-serine deaminase-like pyridoxal phosphate-dependent protein
MSSKILNKYDLDTPALIIDLDLLETNIKTMADYFATVDSALRPHMKTHKIPKITHMEIDAGAIGVTCQKLSEADVFAQAGIKNILISNQIANNVKIRRLIGMTRWADVTVGVDDLEVAKKISEAALAENVTAKVAIEVSTIRCGFEHHEPVLEFVKQLTRLKGLRFMGLWVHGAGTSESFDLCSEKSWQQRKEAHFQGLDRVVETKHMIEKSGIPVEMVSAGYTATYDMTAEYPEVTDVQAGSYSLMDWPYRQLEGLEKFHCALTVLTTVISKPAHKKEMAYTDCGIKNIASEHTGDYTRIVFPRLKGELGDVIKVKGLSEENGHLQGEVKKLKVGDKIEFIPSHSCTTTPRYDVAHVVSGERVVGIWPILARGMHS